MLNCQNSVWHWKMCPKCHCPPLLWCWTLHSFLYSRIRRLHHWNLKINKDSGWVKQRGRGRQCQLRTATHTPLVQESTLWVGKGREWRQRGRRLSQSLRRSPAVVSMTVARRGVATEDNNHIGGIEWRVKSQIKREPGLMCWRLWLVNNKNKHCVDERHHWKNTVTTFSRVKATIVWSLHCAVCLESSDTRKTQNISYNGNNDGFYGWDVRIYFFRSYNNTDITKFNWPEMKNCEKKMEHLLLKHLFCNTNSIIEIIINHQSTACV